MKKPLVIMMGIGYYPNGGILGHLIGVPNDYKNMIKLFAFHWGYPFIYQTDDNKIVYLDKQRLLKNNSKYHTNFKLKWNEDEIAGFVLKSKKIIETILPDGLIFVISSHGDRDKVLIDSNFEEYNLSYIFAEYWNTKDGCPYLADKPKIFFLDMCQGQKTPIPRGKKQMMKNAMKTKGKNDKQNDHSDMKNNDDDKNNMTSHQSHTNTKEKTTPAPIANATDKTDKSTQTESKNDKENVIGKMQEEYLDYENFCVIYGNLADYSVVDGGKKGGYLICGLKSVLKQRDVCNFELNQLIKMIGNETLRLVKGEAKKCKSDFKPSNSPARQIIECQSSILNFVFFGKLSQHQFTIDSQFRYNKYLDFQRRQLQNSFKNGSLNKYVLYS